MGKKFKSIRALALALGSMVMMAGLAVPAASAAEARIQGAPAQCKVRITSMANGLAVRIRGAGTETRLHADSTGTGTAEEFWVQEDPRWGVTYLQSNGNGNYAMVWDASRKLYAPKPDRIGNAEFRWEDVSPGARTFRLVASNDNVVRVEPTGSADLIADNQNRDTWALFRYDVHYCL